MSADSTTTYENKRMSLEEFDAVGAPPTTDSLMPSLAAFSQTTPTSSSTTPHPLKLPKKQLPGWYLKQQEEKESQNMQACLEDYFGNDAFKLGQGESIEAVVEGQDVAIIWDTERNRLAAFPRPTLETTFRRRVMHDALYQDYTEEYDYSEEEDY